jgi:hypothetical protein
MQWIYSHGPLLACLLLDALSVGALAPKNNFLGATTYLLVLVGLQISCISSTIQSLFFPFNNSELSDIAELQREKLPLQI